jgi:hypothetical protein
MAMAMLGHHVRWRGNKKEQELTQPNNRPQQDHAFQSRDDSRPAPRDNTQPWDYERHLDAEHNLLVESQAGWPTTISRYRLYRPMQGKQAEKTLVAFVGNGPAALDHFFRYIHPTARVTTSARPTAWRR